MTIGLCPLDFGDDSPQKPLVKQVSTTPPMTTAQTSGPGKMKDIFPALDFGSECNYLVMFFIAGVFVLAVSDQFSRTSR